jgi:NAD(P)-dependent dehydrogenase (short-subunit alcohol dehydrogenase family)
LTVTESDFDKVFTVNVKSIFLSIPAVVPHMQKHGKPCTIINVASISATRPRPGLVWYAASKGAVLNATKGLAAEYAPQIRVNCVSPLLAPTGLMESFMGAKDTEDARKTFMANVPMQRLCDPSDVASSILYLASDESKFMCGADFFIDGGRAI